MSSTLAACEDDGASPEFTVVPRDHVESSRIDAQYGDMSRVNAGEIFANRGKVACKKTYPDLPQLDDVSASYTFANKVTASTIIATEGGSYVVKFKDGGREISTMIGRSGPGLNYGVQETVNGQTTDFRGVVIFGPAARGIISAFKAVCG